MTYKHKNTVTFQQAVVTLNIESCAKFSVIGYTIENILLSEAASYNNLNQLNLFICSMNLVFYIDMMNIKWGEHGTVFLNDDFQGPNIGDILELKRNQYSSEIRRIIESHDAKWIPYQRGKSQNSNPIDADVHTITSIERI